MTDQTDCDTTRVWHGQEADAVLAVFDALPQGLSTEEAERRLAEHGPNRLPAMSDQARGGNDTVVGTQHSGSQPRFASGYQLASTGCADLRLNSAGPPSRQHFGLKPTKLTQSETTNEQ